MLDQKSIYGKPCIKEDGPIETDWASAAQRMFEQGVLKSDPL